MATEPISLTWSSSYTVAPPSRITNSLPGDKIILPPSALEQLLTASTVVVPADNPARSSFDPFNPYSIAAARREASQWQDARQQLPHPLTFRLVNPKTGNVVHAGIREFSAGEGHIGLSRFLLDALGVKQISSETNQPPPLVSTGTPTDPIDLENSMTDGGDEELVRIVVHAKQLPKGQYVRLRPLEAGYNPDDWKSLLEHHLRENFTTLTMGEKLTIPGGRSGRQGGFEFLIDKFVPEGDGICVVDTDLEVDIEALDEEQARETLKQIMTKAQKAPGTAEGNSVGGKLDIWKDTSGQVVAGDYVDYQLPSWDRSQGIQIELVLDSSEDDLDLLVSPLSTRQRSRPRLDEYVFGDLTSSKKSKTIKISPTNVELDGAEELYISVHAYTARDDVNVSTGRALRRFALRARIWDPSAQESGGNSIGDESSHSSDEEQCKHCHQWIPKRTMMLHENFCLRNNILCPECKNVFQKSSTEWKAHWHCPHDSAFGNTPESKSKHDQIFHTIVSCPSCDYKDTTPELARHRTTVCPGKLILCQFCHLVVPQEGDPHNPSADALLSGLTAHELADGSRTTNCHLCAAIVRLRDMPTHLKHHELSRQAAPPPRICRNVNCGRTLDGVGRHGNVGASARAGQGPGNDLGLCSLCFGPLYVSMHDPEGRAMRRRIERRYLGQLMQGCGKAWCANELCRQGRAHVGLVPAGAAALSTKEALPLVKPAMDVLAAGAGARASSEDSVTSPRYYFCVDEASQTRRHLAQMLAGEGGYALEWCVAACEAAAGELDAARNWLRDWAPKKGEGRA